MQQELKTADPMLQPLKSLVDYLLPDANKSAIVADIDARVCNYKKLLIKYVGACYYIEKKKTRTNRIWAGKYTC